MDIEVITIKDRTDTFFGINGVSECGETLIIMKSNKVVATYNKSSWESWKTI